MIHDFEPGQDRKIAALRKKCMYDGLFISKKVIINIIRRTTTWKRKKYIGAYNNCLPSVEQKWSASI